jgi:hypothetical protein
MSKEKDAQIKELGEELSGIREALEDLCCEVSDLHHSIMVIGILKMMEVRPDLKEKMEPIFDEIIASFLSVQDEE